MAYADVTERKEMYTHSAKTVTEIEINKAYVNCLILMTAAKVTSRSTKFIKSLVTGCFTTHDTCHHVRVWWIMETNTKMTHNALNDEQDVTNGGIAVGLAVKNGGIVVGLAVTNGGIAVGLSVTNGGIVVGLAVTKGGIVVALTGCDKVWNSGWLGCDEGWNSGWLVRDERWNSGWLGCDERWNSGWLGCDER